jgi:hypothetical protein
MASSLSAKTIRQCGIKWAAPDALEKNNEYLLENSEYFRILSDARSISASARREQRTGTQRTESDTSAGQSAGSGLSGLCHRNAELHM